METTLFQSESPEGRTKVTLELREDGALELFFHDIGAAAERMFGDLDYEAWLTIAPDAFAKLAFALLAEKFAGRHDALSALRGFCEAQGVAFESGVWT